MEIQNENNLNEDNLQGDDDLVFAPFDEYEKTLGESPVFTVKRIIAREDLKAFNKFSILKYRMGVLVFTAVFEIISVCMTFSAMAINGYAALFWGTCAVLTPVYFSISVVRRVRANNEKIGKELVCEFYREHFVNIYENADISINYADCNAHEWGKYFFIVTRQERTFIFTKADLGNDTDNFREFLKGKFGEKFKSEKV